MLSTKCNKKTKGKTKKAKEIKFSETHENKHKVPLLFLYLFSLCKCTSV